MSLRASILPGCTGMGSCARLAPAVFRIDPATGKAVVLPGDHGVQREGVLAAAQSCPFVAVEIDGVRLDEPIDSVEVLGCTSLAPGIIELRLRRPGFAFEPGQYVFLRQRDAQGEFFRSYSVVEAADGVVTLCIRLLANGRAGALLAGITPGTRLGLSRAKGLFRLRTQQRPKLFITGGTGLAPVIPMCLAAPQARKRVVVGARRAEDHFWLDRLRAMPGTEVVAVAEQPGPGWDGAVGTVLDALRDADPAAWPEVYASGSPGMVEAVRQHLTARGFPAAAISSDSFAPAAQITSAVAPPRIDWPGLLRRAHVFASAPLALLMLFYALTGFIANRSDLFISEAAPPLARQVPSGVPLTRASLEPFIAGLLPGNAVCSGWSDGEPPVATFRAGTLGWRVAVEADRSLAITRFGTIPDGAGSTPTELAAAIGRHLSGQPDLEHAEADETSLSLEFASVWGAHNVEVDLAARTWTATTSQPHLVVSLIDLHRGKQAGAWQRRIVDLAALGLAAITLSGMGLALAAAARRRPALAMLVGSAVLLLLLLLAR